MTSDIDLTDLYGVGPATADKLRDAGFDTGTEVIKAYLLGSHTTPDPEKIEDVVGRQSIITAIRRESITNADIGIEEDADVGVPEMLFVRLWGAPDDHDGVHYGRGEHSALSEVKKDESGLLLSSVGENEGEAGIVDRDVDRFKWGLHQAVKCEIDDRSWATFATFTTEDGAYTTVLERHIETAETYLDVDRETLVNDHAYLRWDDSDGYPLTIRDEEYGVEIYIGPFPRP